MKVIFWCTLAMAIALVAAPFVILGNALSAVAEACVKKSGYPLVIERPR